MKKIFFSGDSLTESERQDFLNKGYKIDAYDANLKNEEIIKILNDESYDGYILGGDEILNRDTILKFPDSLKVISFFGVGYEAYIDTKTTTEKGIYVTNTPGTNTEAVSQHTIALMLGSIRNVLIDNSNVKKGKWSKERVNDLSGLTVGIIGMGKIGTLVAKILKYSFNSKIIYYSRSRKNDLEKELDMEYLELDELYSKSDIISIHCSLNDKTMNLIDTNAFSKMKKNVTIINTSRANIIDPVALYDALENNLIRSVAFDAFYKEPINLREDKDFQKFSKFDDKKLIITPHSAYFSNQSLKSMESLAIKNVIDILENKTCNNIVNEISDYTDKPNIYDNILLKNYTLLVVEEEKYINTILNKINKTFGKINVISNTNLNDLLLNENIKNDSNKILMLSSNLLGENEEVISSKLKKISNLKAISFGCTFFDFIDYKYCSENNIVVTSLPDYRAELRADLIIYIMQSLIVNITHYIKNPSDNTLGIFPSISLTNKKVGIIGLTKIGLALADKCLKLGMEVCYFSANERNRKYEFKDIDSIVESSDFIITTSYPGIEEYKFTDEIISKINKDAYIVSCEEGSSNLNEELFITLAQNEKIKGYGFTSPNKNIVDYKGNVLILRDQTWDSDEVYNKLSDEWINSINLIFNNDEYN